MMILKLIDFLPHLLQIWVQSDFDYIHSVTKCRLPYAHVYKNSSLLGTPGLALLSKFPPSMVHFEQFVTNGSPFRIWHGDWFTGKGKNQSIDRIQISLALVDLVDRHWIRIDEGSGLQSPPLLYTCKSINRIRQSIPITIVFLFIQTHAQYNDREKLEDQYSMHRLCQMYQLAKFINLNINYTRNPDYSGKDVVILAGDLNVSPDDLHYKFLCKFRQENRKFDHLNE